MDAESGRERILPRASDVFPWAKPGSKGCRKTSAEARLPREEELLWSPKELLSAPGPVLCPKRGVGKIKRVIDLLGLLSLYCYLNS